MYDGNIVKGDKAFGEFMQALDRLDPGGRRVVIVAADHGESMGEHRRFDHNRLYWGILHTPLVVKLPDASHGVYARPVMNADIFPSVLQLLGIEPEPDLRGRSVFDTEREERFQFAAYEDRRSLKRGRYRLHLWSGRQDLEYALYDVEADPAESRDLSRELPELTSELLREANSLGMPADYSATMDQLRSLGYVE
jgi:arylsulfatase A-like enzyme